MRSLFRSPLITLCLMATISSLATAQRMLISDSLNSCQASSDFEARRFNVVFTPNNNSVRVDMTATSSVQGYVAFDISATAYGLEIIHQTLDPCELGTDDLAGMCPMVPGNFNFAFNLPNLGDIASSIPGIAYTVPDLDAAIRIFVNLTETGETVACVEANISNGETVDLLAIKWATAIIAGLALIASAVVSGLGHLNAAAHVAANSLSLFAYFQAQAIIGLTAVPLPPIVQSWTQNFQWSMGIISVGWMQDIMTWYQRATGGQASSLFHSLQHVSVQVQKRSIDPVSTGVDLFKRSVAMMPRAATAVHQFMKRQNIVSDTGGFLVYGIQRVAFRARIETTNLFLTGLTFFVVFVIFTVLFVAAFKGICELAVKQKWMNNDRFLEFRNGWFTVLKGILFRVALLGFPQIAILCLWEFTQNDSPALIVLAVFFFFGMCISLGWGASKVIRIARRSIAMHRNPAYILFSDPQCLNKWGFLYIQFRASAYYYIVPLLIYTLIKAMFVSLSQSSGVAQAVGFIIIEAAALIAASVLRPWMDKSTNSFNIAICVVNFLNAIFLLIFTNVFGAPGLVVGVVGVVLFVMNAAFSLILLLMVIISTSIILFRKNPDARYQFMADDRASFMKSQTHLTTTTELDALAATARGDKAGYKSQLDLDEDHDSLGSDDVRRMSQGPRSPVNPSMPLFPAGGQRPQSPFRTASPSPYTGSASSLSQQRSMNNPSPAPSRPQNNASPWQRGAGYE
ncbi:hypothetical protein S40285_03886 [Stachybotrys chlorohalonatus IBT 40285]|uniref:ML-like domain-containing protein n=1 Tax=Stachybotrys chlorohalonatus (strain IBT 40285) TaxID=1283841 RepID=A0A084QLW7_STAC4|nr:hypothetical protein S40285_03886 [Stachybotrys chlorohalonata IBT 40285]